ncbi:hypothetical protein [Leadbettera azotonutricia]|uniref:Putative peptidoglycan-binding domain 1 protein n=1 Tax=Leadbettera azotonutricia (strain ATCC BAA-888 / DSM 13862 / ZAS-9) TaxID=545695 RepID=F5YDD3_LEAAZ|nr:hypothetical protein [Leadbettera azotonutricia]AEF80398.1 putative peptidoglycan-binding domain 1 protein [Leadbettera azotonutricia ZAS-9]
MAKHTGLTAHVSEEIFEASGEGPLPFLARLRISIHLFFCSRCAGEAKKMELLHSVMIDDFFPSAPALEDAIMQKISAETIDEEPAADAPAGLSLRSWVIIGCFVLLSLSTAFFGMDFINVADAQGSSFLLPVGITIGAVLTGYGAFFIGSHLKELSSRFGIH